MAASATFLDGETVVNGETLPLVNQAEQTPIALDTALYQKPRIRMALCQLRLYNGQHCPGTDVDLNNMRQ